VRARTNMQDRRLGRVAPPDDEHVQKYPLTMARAEKLPPTSVVLGIDWFDSFFKPEQDNRGAWWIARSGSWGSFVGGHAIACEPWGVDRADSGGWWSFYNQKRSDCVGYSTSRAQSLFNRRRYDGAWIYDRCKERDNFSGEGTYLRVGFEVWMELGGVRVFGSRHYEPSTSEAIERFEWARNVDMITAALSLPPNIGYVELLNSWGRSFPHRVRLSLEALERLVFALDGEAGVVVDRR
jgi:hypothetical protein